MRRLITLKRPSSYSLVVSILVLVGVVSLAYGATAQQVPVAVDNTVPEQKVQPSSEMPVERLGYSEPTNISIESIDVDSKLTQVGLDDDGMMAVPSGDDYDHAAWYRNSPSPGQAGASVIIGHIDSADGPSVFFDLSTMKPGEDISITRADGQTVVFQVEKVRSFEKDEFPAEEVYGSGIEPTLRLITCGGEYDRVSDDYAANTIVFAALKPRAGSVTIDQAG